MVAAVAPLAAIGAAAQVTPAQNHAQVVAQGLVRFPDEDVLWQVSVLNSGFIDDSGAATPSERVITSAGFYLAAADPLVTVNEAGQPLQVLAPGEAVFTNGEPPLVPVSASAQPVPYFELNLVVASAAEPESDSLLFSGDQFPVPPSVRDVDLVRDVLLPGESTVINSGEIPTLFFVTQGDLQLTTPDGTGAALSSQQALTYVGELLIENTGDAPAVFLSPVIGVEIASAASAGTGPTAEDYGTVTLAV